jgi:predicted DNA-binding transcriptional regulator YafY
MISETPLMFTPDEAVALYLGASLVEEMWGKLYREPAQGALAKLENVLPDDPRSQVAWARRSLVAAGMRRARLEKAEGYLETLRRAAREQRCVEIVYRGSNDQDGVQRTVDPYALVFRGVVVHGRALSPS